MLLLANPAATTYSQRLEADVARELGRGFSVELVRTEQPGEAIALSRAGAGEGGFGAVAVLGGDGAVNEAANGLAGSEIPLLPLAAGRTNVLARSLGLSGDARQDAAVLVRAQRPLPTRRIDLGTVNGRAFTFVAGIGLSAAANRRLSGRGGTARRLGGHLFVYEILAVIAVYLRDPPRLAVTVGRSETEVEGVSAIAQNADPLTYLGGRALPLCERAGLDTGRLSLAVLHRASVRTAVELLPRVLLGRGRRALRHDDVESLPEVEEAHVRTLDGRPLPVDVDGDYLGELERVTCGVRPRALSVVAPLAGA